jgi:predicted DNA-binding antitoxin AbrB/MazE fold protein
MEIEMVTISVQAVYHKGALRLKKKLDLPEDALVQVDVTPLEATPAPVSTGSLFGAYPELKAIEQFFLDDDEIEYTLKDAKEVYRP